MPSPSPEDVKDFKGFFPQNFDYVDDIRLLSHTVMDTGQVKKFGVASRVGLKMNTSETKVFSLTGHRTLVIIVVVIVVRRFYAIWSNIGNQ